VVVPSLHGDASVPTAVGGWVVPLAVVSVTVACYLAATTRYRALRGRGWKRWRTTSWVAGAVLVALALSPLSSAAAGTATGHMAQHVTLGMIAPLALVLGAPLTLLLATVTPATGRRVSSILRLRLVHVAAHPVTAGVLHVGGLYLLYLTPLYALSVSSDSLHHAVHLHFLAVGYLYSWSIAGPDPAPARPAVRTRVVVLVLAAGAHSYLAKLLYARADELPPGSHHTAAEMEAAAQWMYYGGDVAELLLAGALFATWYQLAGRTRRRVSADHGPASAAAPSSPQESRTSA
jgi:putative membrane protein